MTRTTRQSRKPRSLRTGLLAGAVLVLSAAGALAQETEFPVITITPQAAAEPSLEVLPAPQWREGSEWRYSDGYNIRVSSTNGLLTVFERLDAPGQWFSRFGFLRQDSVGPDGIRQSIYRTISPYEGTELSLERPLTFQREYLKNGETVVHATSWSVEGRDQITVPAGTFDCWVIVWRTRSLDSNWTGFERWWYSPEARNYVRMEYKYGAMAAQSRVLMHYDLAPSPAPAAPVVVSEAAPEDGIHLRDTAGIGEEDGLLWSGLLLPIPVEVFPLPPLEDGPRRSAALD